MATILRLDYPGALHHVYGRGNDKRDIFLDDYDREFFLRRLAGLKKELGFKLYAFCLMTNHYHLLIETAEHPLDKIMGRLLSVYASRFHERHGGVGHLFQGRYRAKICARDSYFLRLIRYIHRNPVQAGMCRTPADWPWSGHRELATGAGSLLDADLPLAFFGARAAYAAFVDSSEDDSSTEFMSEEPRLTPPSDLLDIASQVAQEFGFAIDQLLSRSRRRDLTAARAAIVERARSDGHAVAAIARFLGCTPSAVTQLSSRR